MVAYSYYESDPRVIREAEAAVSGGFEVDFLALRRPGTVSEENVRGVRLIRLNQGKHRGGGHMLYFGAYAMFFARCCWHVTRLFFQRGYRVIHVNNMPDLLVFTTVIPRLFGTRVILDIHDPMPNTFASKYRGQERGLAFCLLLWQERLSAAYSSQIITVHDPVKDGILLKHGLKPEHIEVIANFADLDLFRLRDSYSIGKKIRVAFHGTILERSGLKLLLCALARVRHRERISVKIIGEGDFSEPMKQMIQSLRLESMVEFDNQCYPVHSIAEHIRDCNVGIVPLEISSVTNYALPLKLLEYMSLGLPVIAVRSAAICYYFSEEDCLFFDWNDPDSLSKLLDRIAEDPEVLLHYRERSVALRQKFSWASEKAKYIALLRRLAESRSATHP